MSVKSPSKMRLFDPKVLAHFETQNYVLYYERRWLPMMRATVGLVGEAYGLNRLQATYGAYLIASAEYAWAPAEHNENTVAQKLRTFYEFVKKRNNETYNVAEVTLNELSWWKAHREHFGDPDNKTVVDAFTNLNASLFQVEPERVREAAYWRAAAVLFSDWWVQEGLDPNSPRIQQEEDAFLISYTLLREVASGG